MSALDYQPSSLLNAYPNIAPSTSRDSTPTADQTPSEHSETDEGLPGFESPNFCANQLHYYQKTGEWPPGWNYTATLPGLKPIYVDSDEEVEKAEKKEQGVEITYCERWTQTDTPKTRKRQRHTDCSDNEENLLALSTREVKRSRREEVSLLRDAVSLSQEAVRLSQSAINLLVAGKE